MTDTARLIKTLIHEAAKQYASELFQTHTRSLATRLFTMSEDSAIEAEVRELLLTVTLRIALTAPASCTVEGLIAQEMKNVAAWILLAINGGNQSNTYGKPFTRENLIKGAVNANSAA